MAKSSATKKGTKRPKNNPLIARDRNDIIPHPFVIFGLLSFFAAFIFNKSTGEIGAGAIGIVCLTVLAGVAIYFAVNKKLTPERALVLILIAGFVLRLCYVLYTDVNIIDGITYKQRQHDVYKFEDGIGHAGYIQHFFENGFKLKDVDPTTITQFYHPPLHHMIAAVWMRFLTMLGFGYARSVASIQYLTLFYSTAAMIVCSKIFRELKLKSWGLVAAISLIAFHPTFLILAGSINNDMLSVLFILLSIYNTIVWYKAPSIKKIVFIALSVALGMLTKLSVALIAPPIAAVFLIKLIECIKADKSAQSASEKSTGKMILQYLCFGVVCVPLGLSYVLRNLLKYNVAITYVPRLSDTSEQYLGNYSIFERLFSLKDSPLSYPFPAQISRGQSYFEYNPFVTLIKTSLFGEYNYQLDDPTNGAILPLATVLFWVTILLCVASFVLVAVMLIKRKGIINLAEKLLLGGAYYITLISFVKFAFDYPHFCSQDFRYAVITLVIGAFAIGVFAENTEEKRKLNIRAKQPATLQACSLYVTYTLCAVFCVLSAALYLMIK